jgi:NADH-quinone oxidoreductase subunit M
MGLFGYNIFMGLFCGLTVIFSSVYMIRIFQKSMLGSAVQKNIDFKGLNTAQGFGLGLLASLVLIFGLFPEVISSISDSALQVLLKAY